MRRREGDVHTTHEGVDLRLQVATRTTGAEGVVVLELRDPNGKYLPGWTPGAHIDLALDRGLVRQYSLCGDPAQRDIWRIAVLRGENGRGGSQRVHEALREGTVINVRGPRNHFALQPSPRYVFIAGGIGITPILPMAAAADAAGAAWELHYGGRSRRSMAFLQALENTTGNQVSLHPQDEVGLLDLPILGRPKPETLVYACGPEPLLKAVEQLCANWPEDSLNLERFSPKEFDTPARTDTFEVELTASWLTLTVPSDKSIHQAAEEAGVPVVYSCEEGTCGTCETKVLAGQVDHRDSLLSSAEQAANDVMFICVSRAACSRLVLEL
jgi:ferredoxin-NADP reductase